MMQLVQNVGDVTLELGEVVELRGVRRPLSAEDAQAAGLPAELAQIPIVQVGRVSLSSDPAVAGVVYSRYNIAAFEEAPTITRVIGDGVDPVSLSESKAEWESVDPTPPGPVQPGELLLVVIQGPVEVRAVELGAAIEPGSPLAISSIEGYATVAERSGGKSAESSAAFARALERLEPGRDTVFAYIALH